MALFSPELDVKFLVKIMDKLHREFIHFGTSSSRTSLIDQKEYSYMLKMIKRMKRQGVKIIIHANRSIPSTCSFRVDPMVFFIATDIAVR